MSTVAQRGIHMGDMLGVTGQSVTNAIKDGPPDVQAYVLAVDRARVEDTGDGRGKRVVSFIKIMHLNVTPEEVEEVFGE